MSGPNSRAIIALFALLSLPVWPSLLGGEVDPDAAALRLVVAGVIAVAVEYVVRLFVSAAAPGPDADPGDHERDHGASGGGGRGNPDPGTGG